MFKKIVFPLVFAALLAFPLSNLSAQIPTPIPGDADGDGQVTIQDFVTVLRSWGLSAAGSLADQNQDGKINSFDLALVASKLITISSPTPSPVPPTTDCTLSGLARVDCGGLVQKTDTDNYVNNFILDQVRQGFRGTAAGGAWWGPVEKFYENQVWVVNRDIFLTRRRFNSNSNIPTENTVSQRLTCLKPGKYPPKGTAKNTLSGTHTLVIQRSGGGYNTSSQNTVENFVNMTLPVQGSADSYEIRTRCLTREGVTDNFGDGSAFAGDKLEVNINQVVWYNREPGTPGTGSAHHPLLPTTTYDILDAHAWYTQLGYVYATIDGAKSDNNGNISPIQLLSGTIKGNLTVYGFGSRGTCNPCSTDGSKSKIHHIELRIDQNGDDYTAEKKIVQPSDPNGLGNVSRTKYALSLDTTKVSDGWHVLSWHTHVIDHQNVNTPREFKQLASEVKIPICIANQNLAACP